MFVSLLVQTLKVVPVAHPTSVWSENAHTVRWVRINFGKCVLRVNIPILIAIAALAIGPFFVANEQIGGPIKVEVVEFEHGYQMLRDGKPYFVKGAGATGTDYGTVAANGGNSIRTWAVDMALDKLDAAHRHGLTVALCLPVVSERFGFDYDNSERVQEQFELMESIVLRYKDHPALLAWIVGNELNYGMRNPRVYDAVNDISKRIHEIDPFHPTTTTVAGADSNIVRILKRHAPDLDYISIQLYGAIADLPKYARSSLRDVPFMITEWGPLGHWEIAMTPWNAPIEHTSSEKAQRVADTYNDLILPNNRNLLGSNIFFWGQKQERTPTWYSMFLESGEPTEVVDVMYYMWNGEWPDNRAPTISRITVGGKNAYDGINLNVGKTYEAKVAVQDPDGDPVTFLWTLKNESDSTGEGGDFEESIDDIPLLISDRFESTAKLTAPSSPGKYRIFVYAYDDQGNAAHANAPMLVENEPQ